MKRITQKRDKETPALAVRFGQRIRELRETRGWIQTDLAFHSRLERAFISRVENGKTQAGLESIERLAAALGVSVGKLFRGL